MTSDCQATDEAVSSIHNCMDVFNVHSFTVERTLVLVGRTNCEQILPIYHD